ncbi:MAG: hypothetical protein R3C24_14000 [Cyanobacteriota/Melainabacteria group bacterium]
MTYEIIAWLPPKDVVLESGDILDSSLFKPLNGSLIFKGIIVFLNELEKRFPPLHRSFLYGIDMEECPWASDWIMNSSYVQLSFRSDAREEDFQWVCDLAIDCGLAIIDEHEPCIKYDRTKFNEIHYRLLNNTAILKFQNSTVPIEEITEEEQVLAKEIASRMGCEDFDGAEELLIDLVIKGKTFARKHFDTVIDYKIRARKQYLKDLKEEG